MEKKFTPGPWTIEKGQFRGAWIGNIEKENYSALACGLTEDIAESNANLISAAPELLETLEYVRDWIDGMPANQYVLEKIDIAINKAYGK